jgi:hypothetical protein
VLLLLLLLWWLPAICRDCPRMHYAQCPLLLLLPQLLLLHHSLDMLLTHLCEHQVQVTLQCVAEARSIVVSIPATSDRPGVTHMSTS